MENPNPTYRINKMKKYNILYFVIQFYLDDCGAIFRKNIQSLLISIVKRRRGKEREMK